MGTSCKFLWVMTLIATLSLRVDAQLRVGYYQSTCPNVETIIFQEMSRGFNSNNRIAAGILRMIFHDCFVRGCDGSVLIRGDGTERSANENSALLGFEVIDAAKTRLEEECPGVVSCADILAYASRDAVILTRGSGWSVPAGRLDGTVSLASEPPLNLPHAPFTSPELVANFAAKGLSAKQMVDLSGGHTIGLTHCFHLRDRVFPPDNVDETMPADLFAEMQQACPTITSPTDLVIDRTSVNTFDTAYFRNLQQGNGLMTSDQDLFRDVSTRPFVVQNMNDRNFNRNFADAMVAMTRIGVKTSLSEGEIRLSCQVVNS